MNIHDLMIGDWVNFLIEVEGGETEYDGETLYYQPLLITTIAAWGVGNDGEVASDEGVVNDPAQLQPIPLTAEILEKNFSFDPYNDEGAVEHYYWFSDYIELTITEYTDGLWEVEVDEVEMSGLPTRKMYVSNVHELQHALRLCGIEKEIEL